MKKWGLLITLVGCMALSSCSLLPEEEVFRTAPLIRKYEREEFEQAFVERGDMVLEQKISCTYVPVQTEVLRYTVGGIYHDEIFVEVGDSVQAGQLLAQLDMAGVDGNLESIAIQLEKLGLRMAALEENRALALERQMIATEKSTEAERKAALDQVNEQYDAQLQALQDELTIAQLQRDEYEKQVSERQLRAGISGTVTYVRSIRSGDRSVAGERVLNIADATMSLFRAETKYWDMIQPGQEYVIMVSKNAYEAIVVSEAELGLPETEKVEGKAEYVYLKLKNPTFDLEDGDRGTLTLVLDSREDVLMVPESAVTTANDQTIVYYQDEQGMKAYKAVEIGLSAGDMVEIISGLTEGESIIVN